MSPRKFTLSLGGTHPASVQEVKRLTWPEVVAFFTRQPPVLEDKAAAGWYAFAKFKGDWRDGSNFEYRDALTLDLDDMQGTPIDEVFLKLENLAYVAYTTWSSTLDKPRLRIIIPLDRPATAEEFMAVSRLVAADIGIDLVAVESHAASQMMYLPAARPGEEFQKWEGVADLLHVDEELARYKDWHDRSEWPVRSKGDSTHATPEDAVSPCDKPGVVGLFCRAFDVPAAIDKFNLPYVRVR